MLHHYFIGKTLEDFTYSVKEHLSFYLINFPKGAGIVVLSESMFLTQSNLR